MELFLFCLYFFICISNKGAQLWIDESPPKLAEQSHQTIIQNEWYQTYFFKVIIYCHCDYRHNLPSHRKHVIMNTTGELCLLHSTLCMRSVFLCMRINNNNTTNNKADFSWLILCFYIRLQRWPCRCFHHSASPWRQLACFQSLSWCAPEFAVCPADAQ